ARQLLPGRARRDRRRRLPPRGRGAPARTRCHRHRARTRAPPHRLRRAGRAVTATARRGEAAKSPVDPRMRERWIAARRAEGRRRLRSLAVLGAVAVLGVIAWVVLASPLLDVDRIVVRGAVRTTPDRVIAAADVGRGDAMVWIDTGAAADRVDGLPWIR